MFKKTLFSAVLAVAAVCSFAQRVSIYHEGWIDFNKNGIKDIFEDPMQPVERRIADLLSQMTLEE